LMFWILLLGDVSTAYDICYIHNKNKYACVWCSTYTCIYVDSIHARNMHMNKRRWVSTQPWCDVICNPCNNINMQTMCFANYGLRLKAPPIYKYCVCLLMLAHSKEESAVMSGFQAFKCNTSCTEW
jgi:hypothetical protein